MKKTLTLIICFSISIFSYSQTEVTLEDIWQNYKFYPNGVPGFKSMNDGEHYTTTERNDDGIKIGISERLFSVRTEKTNGTLTCI